LKAGQAAQKSAKHQRTEVEFDGLVRECLDLVRSRHHLQPEALRYEPANGNGAGNVGAGEVGASTLVLGDAEELRTAVSNLLDNAIKYSGKRVDVAVQVETDDKHVVLHVRDSGVGIAPQELKRIFKRFYRVPNRSLAHVKGTGLGLFIVRAIARKHGGRVFAESPGEGQGTTVTMELPRSVA